MKSIDLEDHLRKDHLLMEVQVDFQTFMIFFNLFWSETATISTTKAHDETLFAWLLVFGAL